MLCIIFFELSSFELWLTKGKCGLLYTYILIHLWLIVLWLRSLVLPGHTLQMMLVSMIEKRSFSEMDSSSSSDEDQDYDLLDPDAMAEVLQKALILDGPEEEAMDFALQLMKKEIEK